MFLVSIVGSSYMYAVHNRIVRRYFRHCIVLKTCKMAAICSRSSNIYYFRHNRGSFVFLVSIMGFSGMPYIVVLSENILDIALWVKNSRFLLFVKGRSINEHHFCQNRYRTVILVSIMMFYGIPGLMVWSGSSTLSIALWVKKPIWPPCVQGQTLIWYNFR